MKLGYTLILVAALGFGISACGGKKDESTAKTTTENKPADVTLTMDTIKPSEISNLTDIMSDMAKNYNGMGQKIEAKNYKSAAEAWQKTATDAKAIGNFKPASNGDAFIKHQQDLLSGLDNLGKLINSQSPDLSEKNAAISQACDACHAEFRK